MLNSAPLDYRLQPAAGRLVRPLPDYDGPSRPMHVLVSAGRRQTRTVRAFVERVVAAIGSGP